MPNPFPGMNPYLEDRRYWRDVHWCFIAYAAEALQPQVRPRYHVRIEERVYVEPTDRPIYPDISPIDRTPVTESLSGGVAVAAAVLQKVALETEVECDEPSTVVELPEPVTEGFLEIVDMAHGGKVVTVIELLSHANKTPNTDGHRQYVQKQRETLAEGVNLVEIDLLRDGAYVLAPPIDRVQAALKKVVKGEWHYLVSVYRAAEPLRFYLYAVALPQRLPRIFIPLASDDRKAAVLDLQAVLNRCYEAGAYDDVLDYRQNPPPPELSPPTMEWLDKLLKEKGLRPR
jgi:hypothetical protein